MALDDHHGLPPPPAWLALVDRSSFAAACAADVIAVLVERGGEALYDAYLRRREAPFVAARAAHSLRVLAEWQLPSIDGADHRPDAHTPLPFAALSRAASAAAAAANGTGSSSSSSAAAAAA